jgi:hypothetical protein
MLKLSFEAMTVALLNDELREYVGALAGSNCRTLLAGEDGKSVTAIGLGTRGARQTAIASTKSVILSGEKLGQAASGLNVVKAASDEIKSEQGPVVAEKHVTEEKAVVEEKPHESAKEGGGDVVVTLKTLSAVPYDMLLAFCGQTPAIGVDAEKCKAPFFRKMVESRVTTFLTK